MTIFHNINDIDFYVESKNLEVNFIRSTLGRTRIRVRVVFQRSDQGPVFFLDGSGKVFIVGHISAILVLRVLK